MDSCPQVRPVPAPQQIPPVPGQDEDGGRDVDGRLLLGGQSGRPRQYSRPLGGAWSVLINFRLKNIGAKFGNIYRQKQVRKLNWIAEPELSL